MKTLRLVYMMLAAVLLSACGPGADNGAMAVSQLKRQTSPSVPTADSQALQDGNRLFAFDLYGRMREQSGNLVFSPYSLSLAAAMLYGGAEGDTATQIATTLHFTLPAEQLHPAFNALSLDLAKRPDQSKKVDRRNPMKLNIANAVWGQQDYVFEPNYLDLLGVNYGAGVRLADFGSDPDKARRQVNAWVDRQTEGKISGILPPGSVDDATRMVLANAIYFKAAWQEAFVEKETAPAAFTLLDGTQVQVPTMETDDAVPVRYAAGDGWQALALPYKGDLAEMVILLPDLGQFASFEGSLDGARFASILDELKASRMSVHMPKFEFTAGIDLVPVLSGMGMPLAFDRDFANFSGITQSERLYVQTALHKAYILVNEAGTEAAAATIFGMVPASMPAAPLRIDRPFIFAIRDVPTGTLLFVGRVVDPRQG